KLFIRVDCYCEWIEKKNQYIWRWKDGKKQSVGMIVERIILYDDFVNLMIHSYGFDFQPKDHVIASLLVYLGGAMMPMLRAYVVENPIDENHKL
ncbi:hypothetical protein H5410_061101, partial [Solanum commersonii]